MRAAILGLIGSLALGGVALAADAPVQVIIVGTFHMSNPGHDLHNTQVDDVLQPKPQAQIEAVAEGLARFHPTLIATEWDPGTAEPRYEAYLKGTLPPSRNEVVQLGFRLAKLSGLTTVRGIDVDGEFPFEPVQNYAKAHGQSALLDEQSAAVETMVQTVSAMIRDQGISTALRYLNSPDEIAHGNDFYRTALKIGGGTTQPGADLETAWYSRNFRICANLIQLTHPGDRVVVFYGSGHALLLRQCVQETPGFKLVEANDYLPQ
ncbi:MAG TPA: DUF5694 domain-containing protein [Rhizomicrobium sp.]